MLFEVAADSPDCSETVYLNYARPWLFKNGFDLSETNLALTPKPYKKLNILVGAAEREVCEVAIPTVTAEP